MVRDWKGIATAAGLSLSGDDLNRIAQPLEKLERVFRPLAQALVPEQEPSLSFQAEENE